MYHLRYLSNQANTILNSKHVVNSAQHARRSNRTSNATVQYDGSKQTTTTLQRYSMIVETNNCAPPYVAKLTSSLIEAGSDKLFHCHSTLILLSICIYI